MPCFARRHRIGGGHTDNVLAFGREGRGMKSPQLRPTSPLGSPWLAVAHFRKKEVKMKDEKKHGLTHRFYQHQQIFAILTDLIPWF